MCVTLFVCLTSIVNKSNSQWHRHLAEIAYMQMHHGVEPKVIVMQEYARKTLSKAVVSDPSPLIRCCVLQMLCCHHYNCRKEVDKGLLTCVTVTFVYAVYVV